MQRVKRGDHQGLLPSWASFWDLRGSCVIQSVRRRCPLPSASLLTIPPSATVLRRGEALGQPETFMLSPQNPEIGPVRIEHYAVGSRGPLDEAAVPRRLVHTPTTAAEGCAWGGGGGWDGLCGAAPATFWGLWWRNGSFQTHPPGYARQLRPRDTVPFAEQLFGDMGERQKWADSGVEGSLEINQPDSKDETLLR